MCNGKFDNYDDYFCAAYNHRFKVLCHDVKIKCECGLPPSGLQKEIKIKKLQLDNIWMKKAAVMQVKPKCPNVVVSSFYDTKPMRYLSMVSFYLK